MVVRSTRRALLSGLATVPILRPRVAHAQTDWPTRPVRVMVPYPPAGGADTTARIVYARLSEDLGQQFAIENRGGAGGIIGEEASRKGGARRLHDPARRHSLFGQRLAVCQSAVRLPQGFRAGVSGCAGAEHSGRHPVSAGEYGCRRRGARQGYAGRASTWPRPATAPCSISCSNCSGSVPRLPSPLQSRRKGRATMKRRSKSGHETSKSRPPKAAAGRRQGRRRSFSSVSPKRPWQ